MRVEDRRGISHLTVARSADGRTNWRVDQKPLITDDPTDPSNCWGADDPRITYVEELGGWVIAYTAYGRAGPCVALAVTEDFVQIDHLGVVMPPEDKNASLLPRRIDGSSYCSIARVGPVGSADVWLSRSTDLRSWTTPEPVMQARSGPWWDGLSHRHGTTVRSRPPMAGSWRNHGVKQMVATSIYRVGLVLLDLDNPTRVLRRTPSWLLGPEATYERVGDVPNVVFPTGCSITGKPTSSGCTTGS